MGIEIAILFLCVMFMLPTGEITCVCEEQPQQIEQQKVIKDRLWNTEVQ